MTSLPNSPGINLLVYVYLEASKALHPVRITNRIDMLVVVKKDLEENHKEALEGHAHKRNRGKNAFNINTLSGYFSTHFLNEDFDVLHNQYGNYLAVYCGFSDYEDFVETHTTHTNYTINKALRKIFPEYLSRQELKNVSIQSLLEKNEYKKLEFESEGIRISCISYSLHWASRLIPVEVKSILQTGNKYRYLLTEPQEINKKMIEGAILKDERLGKLIEIRTLYDKAFGMSLSADTGVAFPLSNDIVIYEKLKPGHEHEIEEDDKYQFIHAIIGVKPEDDNILEDSSVSISSRRGKEIGIWFNKIWKQSDVQSDS